MNTLLHKASSRGFFDHGWLRTHHTFSFAGYYNPTRINFGALRVLNDDTVAPGMGFDTHPHREMEIITLPLRGTVEHKDSLGHTSSIHAGGIQVMSAGKGILHSEYNPSQEEEAEFLQIWVFTDHTSDTPRYENGTIAGLLHPDTLSVIVSPYPGEGSGGLWIRQKAWFLLGDLSESKQIEYTLKSPDSYGVYLFVIEGSAVVAGQTLSARDGLGITQTDHLEIEARQPSRLLLIEVPRV